MRNRRTIMAVVGVSAAMAASVGVERDASACGGCFTPPPPPTEVESVITDERMIFSISKDQSTLFDQIQYSGSPSSFAWVLPIKGTVTVGLSADIMFNTIDTLTATQVVQPPTDCPPPPTCNTNVFGPAGAAEVPADAGAAGGGVVVTSQEQVGPYETVQLHSNDGSALTNWLDSHGYVIAPAVVPVIAAYVADKFDFLALKLVPGAGVSSMQPVRVTSQGASVSLPLRMVAIGTGATTGISIWVVADGRWQPQNFPFFTIPDSAISWDWTTNSSNYESLRLATEATYKGRGWQVESSLELNQYTIQQTLEQALQYGFSGVGGYSTGASPSAGDGGAGEGGSEAGVSDGGGSEEAGETAAQVEAADADLGILFKGVAGPNVRITRMRSDVAHSALTDDMVLQASADQTELTNLHYPQQQIGQPLCPIYDSSCVQTGSAPRNEAIAAASGGASGSCATTRPDGRWSGDSRTSIAIVVGLVGLVGIRVRRRGARR